MNRDGKDVVTVDVLVRLVFYREIIAGSAFT